MNILSDLFIDLKLNTKFFEGFILHYYIIDDVNKYKLIKNKFLYYMLLIYLKTSLQILSFQLY